MTKFCEVISSKSDVFDAILAATDDQNLAMKMAIRYNLSGKKNLLEFLRLRWDQAQRAEKRWEKNKAFTKKEDAQLWYDEASKVFDFVSPPYHVKKNDVWRVHIGSYKQYQDLHEAIQEKKKAEFEAEDRERSAQANEFVQDGEVSVEYAPNTISNPYVNILSNLANSIQQTETAKASAKASKDKQKEIKLSERLELLRNRRDQILEAQELSTIFNSARADLAFVSTLFNTSEVDPADINYAAGILSFWADTAKIYEFLSDFDFEGEATLNKKNLDSIILSAQAYIPKLQKLQNAYILQEIQRTTGMTYPEAMLTDMKDIDSGSSMFRDVTMVDNLLLQWAGKTINEQMYLAESTTNVMMDEIEALVAKVKSKGGFEQFLQTVDGKKTGDMVSRFNQNFYDKRKALIDYAKRKAKEGDNSGWEDFFKWKKANTLIFDFRKLFTADYEKQGGIQKFTDEEKAEHIQELKDTLGEKGFDTYMEKVNQIHKEFMEMLDEQEKYLEAQISDPDKRAIALKQWIMANSPFALADYRESGVRIKEVAGENVTFKTSNFNWNYSVEIPRRTYEGKPTNNYDPAFEKIEKDEDLLAFYNYFHDTVNEFKSFFPDYLTEDLRSNFIPFLGKRFLEEVSEVGYPKAFSTLYDRAIKDIRTAEDSAISYDSRDLAGNKIKKLQPTMLESGLTASEKIELRKELEKAGFEYGSKQYRTEYEEREKQMLVDKKSYDLETVLKAFAHMSLTYKHKSQVEDKVRLINNIINEAKEKEQTASGDDVRDRFGRLLTKEGHLTNLKALWEHTQDMFYGSYKNVKPSDKKVYTSKEKKQIKELEKDLEEAEAMYERGEISEEAFLQRTKALKDDVASLGGNLVLSSVGDAILKYIHVKSLGWNPFSALNNLTVGFMSNIVHSSGNEDYSFNDLLSSYKLLLHSVFKLGTLNAVETETAGKISQLMNKYAVLGTASEELNESNLYKSRLGKGAKSLMPYEMTKRVEYVNQGSTFIAMMMREQVTDLSGKKNSLWSAYDKDGNWKTEQFGPEQPKTFTDFKSKVEVVKKIVHGNYDPIASPRIKRSFLGRAFMMFRSWVAEGVANRFEEEKPNLILGRTRRGRYREYELKHLAILPALQDFYLAFQDPAALKDPLKAANMRKNAVEVSIYLGLIGIAIALKASGDDDEDKFVSNYLLNQINRLDTDITFYTSPISFEKLQRSAIPATQIVVDLNKFLHAAGKYIIGEDVIPTGIYAGQSRLERTSLKLIPGASAYQRNIAAGEKESD